MPTADIPAPVWMPGLFSNELHLVLPGARTTAAQGVAGVFGECDRLASEPAGHELTTDQPRCARCLRHAVDLFLDVGEPC